jgi:hypothetical protein
VALPCLLAPMGHADEPKRSEKPAPGIGAVEVHFDDGGVLKMTLQEEKLEIDTAAGKKTVPVAEVRKVELAFRPAEEDAKRAEDAVKRLGSKLFRERQRAAAELSLLGLKAYPALVAATRGADLEIRKRAGEMIETLRGSLPEEFFDRVTEDVVWTEGGKLVGKIERASWKVSTKQFGEGQMRLTDVVRVRSLAHADLEPKLVVEANPGSVTHLTANIGKVYAFKVTGVLGGSVWGTRTYTSDSSIATAAVHAGLVKVGETKVLKVRIAPGQNAYLGTAMNGVLSSGYGPWNGSYEFVK